MNPVYYPLQPIGCNEILPWEEVDWTHFKSVEQASQDMARGRNVEGAGSLQSMVSTFSGMDRTHTECLYSSIPILTRSHIRISRRCKHHGVKDLAGVALHRTILGPLEPGPGRVHLLSSDRLTNGPGHHRRCRELR